ncbi:hypothetical protein SVAN01_08515 [Stagonosporopsis vannaccii]|nr:hypothetical protein SVAN01_08515 [Stagonosporopsis vannaccii]
MRGFVAVTTFFAVMSPALADMITTTTKDAAVQPTNDPPICKFDPVKGEYICPDASRAVPAAEDTNAAKDTVVVAAADCSKCQHD